MTLQARLARTLTTLLNVLAIEATAQGTTQPNIFNPSWLDNDRVLYESDEGGRYALWVVGADGSSPRRFLSVDFEHGQSVVSPDGKRVAFVFNTGATGNDIFVVNVDGTDRVNVTNAPGSQYLPRWSPDGRQVLYISDVSGTRERDLFVVDIENLRATNLTNTADMSETNSGWTPGSKIIFTARQGNETNIFAMNPDGSDRRQLTTHGRAGGPSWAPNGTITFVSRHEGSAAIYVMNADGQNVRKVVSDSLTVSNPVWSPNGQRLAFIVSSPGVSSLFVTGAASSSRTCVAGACRPAR